MVKKITEVGGVKGPEEVTSIKEVSEVNEVTGVSGVKSVSGVSGLSSIDRIEGLGTRLTASNQTEVMQTIEKEAEKLFAGKRIPRKRQKTITDALKMAVLAATAKEEDEEVSQDILDKLKGK